MVLGGVPGPGRRGVCLVQGGGGYAWSQGGVCLVRGLAWSGGWPGPGGGAWSLGVLVETPSEIATAAGGTHPTGMHSCFKNVAHLLLNRIVLSKKRQSIRSLLNHVAPSI